MPGLPAKQSLRRKFRSKKEDSAFIYFVLEAQEGVASYSTLPFAKGDAHRDLELRFTQDFAADVQAVVEQLGDRIYELK